MSVLCRRAVGQISLCRYEVDEASGDVGANELDANMVAHVEALEALDDFSLRDRAGDPRPCSLVRGACDDAVEVLADTGGQEKCSGGLSQLTLDLLGIVLLQRAVGGERAQFNVV